MIRLFSYYGSKVRIGGQYPKPLYPTIVEPFAGAAGYSCNHYRRRCVLYEINPVVHSALRWLIHATPADVLALPLLGNDDNLDAMNISPAAKAVVGFWCATASTAPGKTLYKWARDGGDANAYWSYKCRRRLSVAVAKIKHWESHCQSYESIDVKAIGPATWFVDPPYQKAGVYYKYSSKKIDFAKLGEWCRSLPGQVIVCENEGADWLPFRRFCSFAGASDTEDEGRKMSTEVIWTKGCNQYPTLMGSM